MEKKPKNKWLSFLADGMLSGLMIGIGCVVSMSCENRYLGAFLFSLGLFCIVQFQYGLYTGKVGYIFDRDKAYLGETFFTFLAECHRRKPYRRHRASDPVRRRYTGKRHGCDADRPCAGDHVCKTG